MRRRKNIPSSKAARGIAVVLFLAVVLIAALKWNGFREVPAPPADSSGVSSSRSEGPENAAVELPGLGVYFLDVGQGDSALIRHSGKDGVWTMLIDTGEYAYADGLTDYLHDLGVERIDALVCSHPHTDHMGCMARIVQRFEIGAFYMPHVPEDMVPTTSAYEALLNAVSDKKGLAATALNYATVIDCPESLFIEVLAPRTDADWDDLNNWSGVIRLVYGETSFLFTGDAEAKSEKLILKDGEQYVWDLRADVLKCGHHGSKTSSSAKFLKAVNPAYAVISCGRDNDYGHPHEGTLEKLEKLGTKVYRTDEDGTVLAKSDGETIVWETGLPSVAARE